MKFLLVIKFKTSRPKQTKNLQGALKPISNRSLRGAHLKKKFETHASVFGSPGFRDHIFQQEDQSIGSVRRNGHFYGILGMQRVLASFIDNRAGGWRTLMATAHALAAKSSGRNHVRHLQLVRVGPAVVHSDLQAPVNNFNHPIIGIQLAAVSLETIL